VGAVPVRNHSNCAARRVDTHVQVDAGVSLRTVDYLEPALGINGVDGFDEGVHHGRRQVTSIENESSREPPKGGQQRASGEA
jgi:hypothetical protein